MIKPKHIMYYSSFFLLNVCERHIASVTSTSLLFLIFVQYSEGFREMGSLNHPLKGKQKYCKWQVYRKLPEFSNFLVNYFCFI